MANLPNFSLPADLPVNWQPNQIVSPDGVSVGLTAQHGYNTLSQYINNAQTALNQLREYLANAGFATDSGVADQLANYLPLAGGTLSGVLDHGGKRSANLGAPTAATDGATKGYVDTQAGLKLPLAGGTMTGSINFNSYKGTNLATPTATGDAATKGYVDTRDGLLLPKSGGTMTGSINHGGYRATNLAAPIASTDGATKGYVDSCLTGTTKTWTAENDYNAPYYFQATSKTVLAKGWIMITELSSNGYRNGADGRPYIVTVHFKSASDIVVFDRLKNTIHIRLGVSSIVLNKSLRQTRGLLDFLEETSVAVYCSSNDNISTVTVTNSGSSVPLSVTNG